MRLMAWLCLILFAFAIFSPSPAQGRSRVRVDTEEEEDEEDEEKEAIDNKIREPRKPEDPEKLLLHLMDGSRIAGKLSTRVLTINTEFGLLEIPIASIRKFTPGLNSHTQLGDKVTNLIKSLSAEGFKAREEAEAKLVKMGILFRGEIRRYRNDEDPERRLRIRKILHEFDKLTEDVDEEEQVRGPAPWIRGDSIETLSFTVVGQIQQNLFEFNSQYGKLSIKLADIRSAQQYDTGGPEPVDKRLTVAGNNKIQSDAKSSGIRVGKGDRVRVSASGSVTMTPWGRNRTVTPDGDSNYSWYDRNRQIAGGTLVCRIGKSGEVFKIGSKKTFKAKKKGVLYFGMACPSSYTTQSFPGEFKLRIQVDPKEH